MDEQLIALYHRHVAMAFDRKLRLADFVRDKAGKVKWKYEVAAAALHCGPKLTFEAPLLGTHAHANHSWLWAWSNRNLKLTLTNRALGDLVRVTAHRIGVPMLAHPGFSLEPLLGPELTEHAADVIGGILARELDFDAHHVAPEDAYDSAILVRHEKLKAPEKYPLHRVLTVFPQAVKELPVSNHRDALTAYARDYGLNVIAEQGTLRISDGRGELTAAFDGHDRLKDFYGSGVATPPVKKKKAVVEKPAGKAPAAKAPAAKPTTAGKKPAAKAAPKNVPARAASKPAAKAKKSVVAVKKAAKPVAKKVAAEKVAGKKAAKRR
jgi:hypothetical protein